MSILMLLATCVAWIQTQEVSCPRDRNDFYPLFYKHPNSTKNINPLRAIFYADSDLLTLGFMDIGNKSYKYSNFY